MKNGNAKIFAGGQFPCRRVGLGFSRSYVRKGKKIISKVERGVDDLNAQYIPRRMVLRNPSVNFQKCQFLPIEGRKFFLRLYSNGASHYISVYKLTDRMCRL